MENENKDVGSVWLADVRLDGERHCRARPVVIRECGRNRLKVSVCTDSEPREGRFETLARSDVSGLAADSFVLLDSEVWLDPSALLFRLGSMAGNKTGSTTSINSHIPLA